MGILSDKWLQTVHRFEAKRRWERVIKKTTYGEWVQANEERKKSHRIRKWTPTLMFNILLSQ